MKTAHENMSLPQKLAFFAGKKRFLREPCRHGHDGWHYVSSGECCECVRLRVAQQRTDGKRTPEFFGGYGAKKSEAV